MTPEQIIKTEEPVPRAKLEELTKPELIDLLELALAAQTATTRNMVTLNALLGETKKLLEKRDDLIKTQEAELAVLRNRP